MFDRSEELDSQAATQTLAIDRPPVERLSIVHVVSPGAFGGLETVVHALATGHAEAGHAVRVVSVLDDESSRGFLRRFAGTAVSTESLHATGRGYIRERIAAHALFQRLQPDVVHTHGLRPDIVDAPAASAIGVSVVTTIHGYTASSLRTRLYARIQRASLRSFDAVVAVSRQLAARLASNVEGSRLHVIPNAFIPTATPLDRAVARGRLGVRDDRFLIGWVGRISPEKALDTAIAALSEHVRTFADAKLELAVVGEGAARSSAQRLARQLRVARFITWHGARADAAALMRAFDVLVLSSRAEGTPMVLLEAMHAGTPIIATGVGGVPEMLSAREALLVKRNDPRTLAAAIHDVMREPGQAQLRARRAADVLHVRYDGARWLDAYAALYGRLRLDTQRRRRW